MSSSALGSFFYLIVGVHALHALVALGVLLYLWRRMGQGSGTALDAGRSGDLLVLRGRSLACPVLEGLPVMTAPRSSLWLVVALVARCRSTRWPVRRAWPRRTASVQMAFISATAFMTFLPLGLLGGLVLWLRRRARQLDAEEAAGVIRLPTSPPRTNRAA